MAFLLVFSILFPGVLSDSCTIVPFTVPIQDVQVLDNVSDSFMKGIPATVGNPAQNIVVLPWAELNNTWLYDENDYCDPTVIFTDTICQVRRGNFFLEDDSTSFDQAADVLAAGGASLETDDTGAETGIKDLISSSLGGKDTLNLGTNMTLSAFPFGIPRFGWDGGYTTLHALGLGPNSTLLNHLVEKGRIGSRTWSIFWGRMWANNDPMDGSIVFGGYDEKKILGNNYTKQLDFGSSGCWTGMKVSITDITLNFVDGSEQSIMSPNSAVPVCIVPQRQLLFESPATVYDSFENATQTSNIGVSFGLHWSARLFEESSAFDGDITFQLDSSLEIRVPNDQYVVPFVEIAGNGSRIFNESRREVLISTIADQPATLGRYFLTAAYLMINQDANTFTLWQANSDSSTELVPVMSESVLSSCDNATASNQSSTTPEAGTSLKETSNKLSGAAIGGTVVGVLVGIAAFAILIYFFIYKPKHQRNEPPMSNSYSNSDPGVALSPMLPEAVAAGRGNYRYHTAPYKAEGSYEVDGSNHNSWRRKDSHNNIHELAG